MSDEYKSPPRLEDLPHWPVYDEPYIVTDELGEFIEIISRGADSHATALPTDVPGMIVTSDHWNKDFTARVVLSISAISSRADAG